MRMGQQKQRGTLDKNELATQTEINTGQKNVQFNALVPREKILLPPLHIKLGLIKQFVKALNKDSEYLKYVCQSFPQLSEEKLKEGIFDGPQIIYVNMENCQLRIIFLYQFKLGHKAAEASSNINGAFGEERTNEHTIQRWFQKFSDGVKTVEDHEGR